MPEMKERDTPERRQVGTNLTRGVVRGLTADLMGSPVDLGTNITNLGLAGGGYLAHKLGLVDTPPDLIDPKNVPLSSDWLAKNTPLEEQEGEGKGYHEGRLGANVLSMLLRGTGRMPTKDTAPVRGSPEAQRGALYLDKQGKLQGEDLAAYHTTEGIMGLPREGQMNPKIRPPLKELTHPSFAITSNTGDFDTVTHRFGNNILIPRPQIIDPKTGNVSLKAHDYFTPRRDMSYEAALFEKYGDKVPPELLAKVRLKDRFSRDYIKGGTGGEGGGGIGMVGFEPSTMSMNTTPRFQTMEHFDTSPKGGGRIRQSTFDPEAGTHFPQQQFDMYDKLSGRDTPLLRVAKGINPYEQGSEIPNALQSKALDMKYWANKPHTNPKDIAKYGGPSVLNEQQAAEMVTRLRKYKKDLIDYSPSEYGEAKKWGPVQLNRDNFLGYIADTDKEYQLAKWNLAERKGIPVYKRSDFDNNRTIHDFIAHEQSKELRRGK